jgi:hypothetical protein
VYGAFVCKQGEQIFGMPAELTVWACVYGAFVCKQGEQIFGMPAAQLHDLHDNDPQQYDRAIQVAMSNVP